MKFAHTLPLPRVTPAKAGVQRLRGARKSHWMTRFARPFGAALQAFCARSACPAFAGMTARKNQTPPTLPTHPESHA